MGRRGYTIVTGTPCPIALVQRLRGHVAYASGVFVSGSIVQKKGLIVVFEPDDLIRGLLERWLGEVGYDVVSRSGFRVGDNALPGTMPHLVIVDVPNPRIARTLIRSLHQAYASPILALSARFQRGLGSSRNVAARLGVRAVLPKPFTREEVLRAASESIRT